MKIACGFALLLLLPAMVFANEKPNQLSQDELWEGWIQLFDGESLYGWKPASKANWEVRDGAIHVSEGEPGLLHTTTQFGNYTLRVDLKAAERTNSGIFLRTSPKPASPTDGCYELNIAELGVSDFPTGSLVGRKASDLKELDTQWHTLEVTADGAKFTVKLDGRQVLEFTDESAPLGRGFIGLQFNRGEIAFRNIFLKPLGLKPLFNGKNLNGWTILEDAEGKRDKSEFAVTDDGVLHMKDGPGQLETNDKFADVVLQTEAFVNGEELNSGIFFRSIPGEYQNGYEAQIHNGTTEGDANKPNNSGTGGIFRRQEARKVNAKDFEWFAMTIIAVDKQIATWVNGIQVTDWTDTRKPDPNPRRGLRQEAGTIILQGHDPTTDLQFRKIEASEVPPRR